MNGIARRLVPAIVGLAPRFLPFADAATPELGLARLLRLSLFQVSVGLSLVLLVGTLNRVMIVELGVSAALVGIMVALPVVFAPFRALIGYRSDHHRCELGWRRVPFLWKGTLLQFGGLSIMPFALLVLSGGGQAAQAPAWIGPAAAGLAFLLVGAGLHTTQTVGLALATDLAPPESHPKVVGLMYVMLLLGSIGGSLAFGALLVDFNPPRLVSVIQGCAALTVILNITALWKQEARKPRRGQPPPPREPGFGEAWALYRDATGSVRLLLAIGLGTMGFGMADIVLEPYGGQVLNLTVSATTRLTAALAAGSLIGFAWASRILGRGGDALGLSAIGALLGIPAFAAVILAAPLGSPLLFVAGTFLIGFGTGLFAHGTLTASMNRAARGQAGLALGAWGAVQATAAGVAVASSGVIRDGVMLAARGGELPFGIPVAASGYTVVYVLEGLLLVGAALALRPLRRRLPQAAATAQAAGAPEVTEPRAQGA